MLNNIKKYYRIGGLVFCLEMPDFRESDLLSAFRTDETRCDFSYVFEYTDNVTVPVGELLFTDGLISCIRADEGIVRTYSDERDGRVIFVETSDGSVRYILFDESRADHINSTIALEIMDIPSRIIESGGIILHSSFIGIGGEAVLFTGQKGIGKSTQAALWQKYRGSDIINGDRAIIRKKDGKWFAWGSPYCGTSKISRNLELPLKAIVSLAQSSVNSVKRENTRESFRSLLDGASFNIWDKEQVQKLTDTCSELISDIPFYLLECTPDERAVAALEEIL